MNWKGFLIIIVGLLAWAVVADADGLSVSLLTDVGTSRLEGRVGIYETDVWEAGLTGTWYAEDTDPDWGVGGYAKMIVDPEGSVPVANWLPKIGSWLNLPETLAVKTYLLGKLDTLPMDDGPNAITASAGAGMEVGPAVLEWVYRVIEGGSSSDPVLSSGPELWFGGRIEF
jgi:hypothetical protein